MSEYVVENVRKTAATLLRVTPFSKDFTLNFETGKRQFSNFIFDLFSFQKHVINFFVDVFQVPEKPALKKTLDCVSNLLIGVTLVLDFRKLYMS